MNSANAFKHRQRFSESIAVYFSEYLDEELFGKISDIYEDNVTLYLSEFPTAQSWNKQDIVSYEVQKFINDFNKNNKFFNVQYGEYLKKLALKLEHYYFLSVNEFILEYEKMKSFPLERVIKGEPFKQLPPLVNCFQNWSIDYGWLESEFDYEFIMENYGNEYINAVLDRL